ARGHRADRQRRLRDGKPDRQRRARPIPLPLRPRRNLRPSATEGGIVTRASRIPNLGGAKAFILHRPHATVNALARQLGAIGLDVRECWPELPPDALAADFVFFDVDLGFDEQFPWKPG